MALPKDPVRTARENAAGIKAAAAIQRSVQQQASRFKEDTGDLRSFKAKKRMRSGELRAISIIGPVYGYKLNYGFIGTKSNGVFQRLKQSNFIGDAVLNNRAIEELATEISEARADQVVANIAFSNVSNSTRR